MTRSEGRKFGLTVGIAFLVLASVLMWWRHRPTTAMVFATIGVVLVVAGLIIPTLLGPVNRAWMGLAHAISKVTTPIFMGVVYFLVLMPIGLVRRAFGHNTLEHGGSASAWAVRPEGRRRSDLERQF